MGSRGMSIGPSLRIGRARGGHQREGVRASRPQTSRRTALIGPTARPYGGTVDRSADRSARRSEPGPLLFARFALPPNRLGYCGGDEAASLLQHLEAGVVDEDLIRQCRDFEGAYPYLRLIAGSAGIADPLERAVVEGYWLGGPAVSRVAGTRFAADLEERFRPRTAAHEWPWLAAKPADGALPHHSFHVLEVLPRVGLLRGGVPPALVPTLEQCLVRPARVIAVEGDGLRVRALRLAQQAGHLELVDGVDYGTVDGHHQELADSREELVAWRSNGTPLVPDPRPGDTVALHWGWACDRLTAAQAARLLRATRASVARANETV